MTERARVANKLLDVLAARAVVAPDQQQWALALALADAALDATRCAPRADPGRWYEVEQTNWEA